jgi:hypothetical protein
MEIWCLQIVSKAVKTNFRHSVSLLVHLKYMFHLYDEVLLIEEHLLLLLSLYILYRACGFTVPRSKRKVLQNLCCQNCNNGTGNLKCNEFNTKHRQSCYYWWVKNIQNLWVLCSIHERCSYGQQDLLHVYTLQIYICSLNNLSVCLLLFVLLKTYKKAHKFNF